VVAKSPSGKDGLKDLVLSDLIVFNQNLYSFAGSDHSEDVNFSMI
jgi:hypothetical protein